jgi:hypothetical protein
LSRAGACRGRRRQCADCGTAQGSPGCRGVLLLESFALYVPEFKLNTSYEYKTRLDAVRERQKTMIKSGEAAIGNDGWEVNGSKAEGRKLVNDMVKLLLRSFNNECDVCVDNVKFDNIELGEKRIRQSFDACNRLV